MTQPSRVQSAHVHKNPGRFGGSFRPEMLRPCFRGGRFAFMFRLWVVSPDFIFPWEGGTERRTGRMDGKIKCCKGIQTG